MPRPKLATAPSRSSKTSARFAPIRRINPRLLPGKPRLSLASRGVASMALISEGVITSGSMIRGEARKRVGLRNCA